ncbi:transcriptional regulator, AraC family [Dysgonomonas macrotermitis]|uniref:Transcriptional regulator, AraC family n=2 Tax=Dysgonomonas macrotermitis TaxID=1346286 RepID=A0A1M4SPZ4_9BACT|nr:transcriptional regulator, AraC family [Dysgonomonas macrotermitis]
MLAPYVKHYWFLKANITHSSRTRIVPTGHVCMMFHRGERIFSESDNQFQPQAFISGQEKSFTDLLYTSDLDMICIVFHPIGARVFFKMPMSEINGLRTDIYDLEDRELIDLRKVLEETQSNIQCALLIEQFLFKRIRNLADYNLKRINTAIELINNRQTDIKTLAGASCLSPKQFKRIFTEMVGANPKEYQRVIRFQRALFVLQTQSDINMAQLAFECGYYDQPHLIKEFKVFSGYTPLEYLAMCTPYSDYFS